VQSANADRPGVGQMLAEILDLSAGVGVMLLPLLTIAIPGVLLFFILPVVLLAVVAAVPAAIAAALLAPPFLFVRLVRRRRR
jgi:hypothetical protein